MFLAGAAGLALFTIIAAKAGSKGFAKFFGVLSFLCFVTWLASGPGFDFMNFVNDPKVNVPDNIPIPGGGK